MISTLMLILFTCHFVYNCDCDKLYVLSDAPSTFLIYLRCCSNKNVSFGFTRIYLHSDKCICTSSIYQGKCNLNSFNHKTWKIFSIKFVLLP